MKKYTIQPAVRPATAMEAAARLGLDSVFELSSYQPVAVPHDPLSISVVSDLTPR